MRGHIRNRYKGSYDITVELERDPITKKRQQYHETIKGTKKDAEKRLAELEHQLDKGSFARPGKLTVAEFLEAWLKENCVPNRARNTTETYDFFIHKHIIPSIGMIPLTSLRPGHLQHLYKEKQDSGLGDRSRRYIHSTLHRALKIAVQQGLISSNPADAVESPKVKHRDMKTMSEPDIHLFLEYARSTPYYALFYTALFTGMRRSELLALQWADIDLATGTISVNRTLHQLRNKEIVISQPKTAKSRRLLELPDLLTEVLKEHRKQQKDLLRALGKTLEDDTYVFLNNKGQHLLPDAVSKAWSKLAKLTGMKGIRLHDARHTHASLMLKGGEHPKVVQERLGHASIQVTLDTYSHVTPGIHKDAAKRFNEMFASTKENEAV
jgi:integrase